MTITITDLKNQIHSAGHFVTITQDHRGLFAGSPVNIVINRNNSATTYIHLLTMSPTVSDSHNSEDHFITHITIDDAITFRVPKTLSAPELWQRIYEFRVKTMPPPEPDWRQRNRHHRHRQFRGPRHSTHQRYLQRPSKHQPRQVTSNARPI